VFRLSLVKKLILENHHGVQIYLSSESMPSRELPSLYSSLTQNIVVHPLTPYHTDLRRTLTHVLTLPFVLILSFCKKLTTAYLDQHMHMHRTPYYMYTDYYGFWYFHHWYLLENCEDELEQELSH
jgi:hypothetical protein